MTGVQPKKYFFFDDGQFNYVPLVQPTSQQQMLGYKAVAWDVSFDMTGWWQGHNAFAITTNDRLFDIKHEVAQGIQVQHTWNAGQQMPWLWEADQGQADSLNFSFDYSVPVSVGSNLRMVIGGYRFEDMLTGQRLWLQFQAFDSQNTSRPINIYKDPHTGFNDVVIQVQIDRENDYFFDFSKSDEIAQNQFTDTDHIEVGITRQGFTDALATAANTLGIPLTLESGYWSMIQAMPFSVETASFATPQWGIGSTGAIQVFADNLQVWDG